MYYTIYQTTNLINGKIYIGAHKTKDLEDGYMGSGKILNRAIEKYGLENFEKEILGVYETPEEMFSAESSLVNSDFVDNPNTYNLKEGGVGGFDYIFRNGLNDAIEHGKKGAAATKRAREETPEKFKAQDKAASYMMKLRHNEDAEWREKLYSAAAEERRIRYLTESGTFAGKTHCDEAKEKIGKANSVHQQGTGNSQYGTCWIYNTVYEENMKIKKCNLDHWVSKGWTKGRKIKF